MNPDTIGCVWTGEFDLNTLRVDGEIFESGKKKLRILKYPDTCGWGLILLFAGVFVFVAVVVCFKATKYEIQKPSTCRATFFRCKFGSMFRVFHLA